MVRCAVSKLAETTIYFLHVYIPRDRIDENYVISKFLHSCFNCMIIFYLFLSNGIVFHEIYYTKINLGLSVIT